jgi:2-dehydropantoate 2-reductase
MAIETLPEDPAAWRIAVVGSGAVGCYYGGRLARHGNRVRFLMRRDLEHVRAHGLDVRSCLGDFRVPEVEAFGSTEEMGEADVVLVTLKTTANGDLERLLPPLLHGGTRIVTLQNGLGNEEFLAERWGAERVLGGVCFTCINRTGPGLIEHTAQGAIAVGSLTEASAGEAVRFAGLCEAAGIECRVASSIAAVRWRKLVWNIPFNGLAIAGGGIDTSRILGAPALERLVRELMGEVIGAAERLGYRMAAGLIEDQLAATRTMAAYRPSSMIDYVEGREVEVESIWGEPARRAAAAGVAVPKLEMLYGLIRGLVGLRRAGDAV